MKRFYFQSLAGKKKGFSLIESLTLLFIFSVITMTFYGVFQLGLRQIIDSKNRLAAMALANEKMEIVRSLAYDTVGTRHLNQDGTYSYGVPAGDILEYETVAVNTNTFTVHTFVQYIDDVFDGYVSGTTPADSIPNDYKRVKIEVSWGDASESKTVSLISLITPPGLEVSAGGGVLSVNIIDEAGLGVDQASVHITNTALNPDIDVTTTTDSSGNLILPGSPASAQTYKIEASKNNYFSAMTYPPYPTSAFNPSDIHASVADGVLNQKTLIMSQSSDLSIHTKDPFGAVFPSLGFHLKGGRQIGTTTAVPAEALYLVDDDYNTSADGEKDFTDQSPGIYTFSISNTSQYQLLHLDSDETVQSNITLLAGEVKTVNATVIDKQIQALLAVVSDSVSLISLQGASVHLTNTTLGYDATVVTDRYGQAYFPTSLPELANGTYDIDITLSGYSDYHDTISISSGDLSTENIEMTPL